jgi:iron complex outermembrane receptor protein
VDRRVLVWLLVTVAALVAAKPTHAQTSSLLGTIVSTESGTAVAGASVEIHAPGTAPLTAITDAAGRFRRDLPPGSYSIIVRSLGMETARVDAVDVKAGETTQVRVSLTAIAFVLNPVVVSVSRREEKVLDAPAAITVVRRVDVERRIGITVDEHVRTVPGMDVASAGLQRRSVVARGFNDTFSTALLLLTDYRYANNPSNRLNAFYMIPVNDLDIDRIEVSLGPGSALYGPNATNGVLHVLTKSPIDQPGTSVSVAGGERSVFQGAFRTAFAPSERIGFKLSGQYFTADDWRWTDPVEEQLRAADPTNPYIGARDFAARRWSGEARMDVRGENGAELVTSIGTNLTGAGIELNGTGRARVDDYRLSYGQARFRSGRLFTQAFVNVIDAGDSRFLRTGLPVVDRSRVYAFQMQHGADVGSTALVYGIDAQRTDTRTGGTITGRFEDDDRVDEAGAYVHAVTRLSDRFETVAALRVDAHNRLEKPVLSPRAALVFRPREGHTLRGTFNRAFRTPAVLDLFLDLQAGRLPITPTIFYDLRGVGVGEDGYTFNTCEGGFRSLCMRVPGASGELPANAALVWDQLIAALAPDLASLLPNPGSAVGTVLRSVVAESAAAGGAPFRLDPTGPTDI